MDILLVEDDYHLRRALKKALQEQGIFLIESRNIHSEKITNFTPDREDGWYRQFEKNNKRKNFARK